VAHKPKALKPATQPVAQPVPVEQNNPQSTPLVFVREGKVVALSEAEALALSQAEARHYRASQQAMRRQPKHIQALGRSLWKLWG
jgi:hypothetical protein